MYKNIYLQSYLKSNKNTILNICSIVIPTSNRCVVKIENIDLKHILIVYKVNLKSHKRSQKEYYDILKERIFHTGILKDQINE